MLYAVINISVADLVHDFRYVSNESRQNLLCVLDTKSMQVFVVS